MAVQLHGIVSAAKNLKCHNPDLPQNQASSRSERFILRLESQQPSGTMNPRLVMPWQNC